MSSTQRVPEIDELAESTAPADFRTAVFSDPFAGVTRYDFDAWRGPVITDERTYAGGTDVPLSGYYFDVDGGVSNWYRKGEPFPRLAPGAGAGGRFIFLTNRVSATTNDLRWIILRRGWAGNIKEVIFR